MNLGFAVLSILAGLVFAAAFQQDLARRRIPNALPAALLVIGAIKWLLIGRLADVGWALAAAGIVLGITAFMFWRGWMGGGDVKLLTASSFMLGSQDTPPFIVLTSFIGGVVAIVVLIHSLLVRRAVPDKGGADENVAPAAKATVPYGVAISLAAVWFLFKQWTLR
ncbi:MAG TPA: prepilin peptidase [Stellaceae bacterium]|nr:prepilin peptidase [Stellaceae bacterium]